MKKTIVTAILVAASMNTYASTLDSKILEIAAQDKDVEVGYVKLSKDNSIPYILYKGERITETELLQLKKTVDKKSDAKNSIKKLEGKTIEKREKEVVYYRNLNQAEKLKMADSLMLDFSVVNEEAGLKPITTLTLDGESKASVYEKDQLGYVKIGNFAAHIDFDNSSSEGLKIDFTHTGVKIHKEEPHAKTYTESVYLPNDNLATESGSYILAPKQSLEVHGEGGKRYIITLTTPHE